MTPVRSPLRRLRVTDPDARYVGDRVARAPAPAADRARDLAPALSQRRPPPSRARVVEQAGGELAAATGGDQRRIDPVAGLEAPRAAGMEAAPGRDAVASGSSPLRSSRFPRRPPWAPASP